jgi:hypothetical protein
MERTQIIEHHAKKIFFIDFSNLKSMEEINTVIMDAQKYIHSQPKSSILTLTTVEGTHFNNNITPIFTEYVRGNKPFVKASAVIGISGLKQILYNTMMKMTGRDTRSFSTIDQAKEWLVSQS